MLYAIPNAVKPNHVLQTPIYPPFNWASIHLILPRLPHISINSSTKRRKCNTTTRYSLRPSILSQNTTRQTPGRHTIRKIICSPQPFNAALDAAEQGADLAEVTCHGVGACPHIFETDFELLLEGEGGYGVCLAWGRWGAVGSVVGHLVGRLVRDKEKGRRTYRGHEETEDTAHTEAHYAGHD